eukprot:TRINITY_DN1776_c0_g2_i1.p1 TRINITY_DN1776_c0_g2~~TRINITY_DN1776_c0_g2_i1.p1  ORF type:complete len:274 (-),score=51.56 TRINITY_DN1776_c0_g2_i1:15-836(-)
MDKKEEVKEIPFYYEKHEDYLLNLDKTEERDAIGYYTNDHLRIPGGYWCIGALHLLNTTKDLKDKEMITFLKSCSTPSGGFGANLLQDPSMTSTHYVVLLFSLYKVIWNKETSEIEKIAQYVSHLQDKKTGSFKGDDWGEVDLRFMYCAVSSLKLLNQLSCFDVDKACEFILKCCNPDGAFGGVPGAESHAAYTFCAVGALAILNKLHLIDLDKLGQWLVKRQTTEGGFNGRPEKLPDVCYSWWILSALYMICLLYTSPSPRDATLSRMPSSA